MMEGYLLPKLQDMIILYDDENKNIKKAIDWIQKEVSCCGANEPGDWDLNTKFRFVTHQFEIEFKRKY